jgi:hypothetical protein
LAAAPTRPEPAPAQKKTSDVSDPTPPAEAAVSEASAELDPQSAAAIWRQTLAQLGDVTADCAARAEGVAISGPNRLVVRFGKAYTQAQLYCERPERRQKLEQTLSRIAGRDIRIDFVTLPDEPAAAGLEPTGAKPPVNRRQRQQELLRHPLVRKAAELFDTEIIAVLDAPPAGESGEAANTDGTVR